MAREDGSVLPAKMGGANPKWLIGQSSIGITGDQLHLQADGGSRQRREVLSHISSWVTQQPGSAVTPGTYIGIAYTVQQCVHLNKCQSFGRGKQ